MDDRLLQEIKDAAEFRGEMREHMKRTDARFEGLSQQGRDMAVRQTVGEAAFAAHVASTDVHGAAERRRLFKGAARWLLAAWPVVGGAVGWALHVFWVAAHAVRVSP